MATRAVRPAGDARGRRGAEVLALAAGELITLGRWPACFSVLAISVRHAIALIDRAPTARGGRHAGLEVAIAGVQERLVPIVTTVLGTPSSRRFIVLGDVAGLEIMRGRWRSSSSAA